MKAPASVERTLECAVRGGARVVTRWSGSEHVREIGPRDWAELLASRPATRPREAVERAPVLAFGRRLFDLVLRDDPNWQTATRDGEWELCVRFLADGDCVDLPWEWLARGDSFLALEAGLHVCRHGSADADRRPPAVIETPLPWRVLFASAVAAGDHIDVQRELSIALDAAAKARREGRPTLDIDAAPAADLATLDRRLREAQQEQRPYHLVHVATHASPDGRLVLENAQGEAELASGVQLAERLAASNPCAVVSTSCWGDGGHSLAAALARQGVPEVVGFSGEAADDDVLAFVEGFYAALGQGPFAAAVRAGRLALQSRPDEQGRALADWTRVVHFEQRALVAPCAEPETGTGDATPAAGSGPADRGHTTYNQSPHYEGPIHGPVTVHYGMQGDHGTSRRNR
jgi:hypothetical protein